MRPQEGLIKATSRCREDSALKISAIVKLAMTGRTANSFVTTNERSLFGRTALWTYAIQSAARGPLSYVTRALAKSNFAFAPRLCQLSILDLYSRIAEVKRNSISLNRYF